VHLLLGQSALDLPTPGGHGASREERWCNAVAAQVLVPASHLQSTFDPDIPLREEVRRLHLVYRASGLVILSQLFDVGAISWSQYRQEAAEERRAALEAMAARSDGGNYYNTVQHMIGRRLLEAVATDVRSGRTTTTEAMSLLQVSSYSTLEQLTGGM
jgi:Zn-dependent peptidase ImmA (M78 family)